MTNNNQRVNLDLMAAQHAQAIVSNTQQPKALDNMITKALGVLQENGIYASALFLASRKGEEKEQAEVVMGGLLDLLDKLGKILHYGWAAKPATIDSEKVLKYLTDHVVVDLERLMLAKETLEQMLIYARYGAKARTASKD